MLEPECEILATFADGASLLAKAEKYRPDLILADFGLPAVSGIEVNKTLEARYARQQGRVPHRQLQPG